VSEVYTDDAVLAGEFYAERRKVVPYERIPKRLVQAFIASEDSGFFDHFGVDVLGTLRAAVKTGLRKVGLGGSVQGGSTLTQQTAKAVLVSAEMGLLDAERIMAEAEASVPPLEPPAPAALQAEQDRVRKEKLARLAGSRAAAAARARDGEQEEAAAAAARQLDQRLEKEVREEALARLVRVAQQERQERVREAFLRVREERRRAAFQKATVKEVSRKIREAILARRLEEALTKEEILYLYLNNVFLGHHAYGVQSAAENYFRKDVRDLTLGEMALIAGLPQAPSRYSPFRNPEAARKRRVYVLRRMLDEGMISRAEHDAAAAEPVKAFPVEDVFHEFAPYFVEQVRKDVVDRYSSQALLNEGLRVFTTMDSERQRAAQEAVLQGLLEVDKRQGYRGPVQQLAGDKERQAFLARAREVMGKEPLVEGRLYVGLVTKVDADGKGADVQVGSHKGRLPLLGMRWARKVNPEGYYPGAMLTSVRKMVAEGDVLVLRHVSKKDLTDDREQWDRKLASEIADGTTLFRLEQEPETQSALVSIDPHRQYLTAMVGGYDFDANEFNRAFQACRQPGSAFKPLVYSAAIELLNWTPATVIVDAPIVEHDPENKVSWKPANYSEEFRGDVLLRTALVNSMNIPAVKTFAAVGVRNMADWSKKLGLSTPMNLDFSAALGSSCVYPLDLA
jgi:membrane carboxypeptidase/penicillin-binding protein